MLCLLALTVALITWAVLSGGPGGKKNGAGGDGGRTPAASITPSPGPTGPGITSRPGGTGGSGGDGGGGGENGGAGTGGIGGDDGESGSGGGAGGSSGGGSAGAVGGNQQAATSLPDCTPGKAEVTVRSVKNAYEPGERPRFELTVKNSGGSACKTNLGQAAAVLTISDDADSRIWSSGDCPSSRDAEWVQVPAGGQAQLTFDWDRKRSAAGCATPAGAGAAGAGTYLVEAKVEGLGTTRTSFVLKAG